MLIRRAVMWSGIEAVAGGTLSLASVFVIARMIGPDAVGIGAAAVATHVVFWVAINGIFADALVQRASLDDRMIASAFWSGLACGTIGMVGQILVGVLLAWQFDDPRLGMMGVVLALTLPLVGFGGAAQGLRGCPALC